MLCCSLPGDMGAPVYALPGSGRQWHRPSHQRWLHGHQRDSAAGCQGRRDFAAARQDAGGHSNNASADGGRIMPLLLHAHGDPKASPCSLCR